MIRLDVTQFESTISLLEMDLTELYKSVSVVNEHSSNEEVIMIFDKILEPFGLEVIIVDNGSSDICFKVIKKTPAE